MRMALASGIGRLCPKLTSEAWNPIPKYLRPENDGLLRLSPCQKNRRILYSIRRQL